MKILALGCLITILFCAQSQIKTNVYFFPGQGSDKRIFDSLKIDSNFNKRFIEYPIPEKKTTLREFSLQLSSEIDTTVPFTLVGVSLGGMICSELSEILHPQRTIIISSAKNREELPLRYRFQKTIPLYKLFPGFVLKGGARFLQPIVEPDRKKNKHTFKSMLKNKHPKYLKRTKNNGRKR